MTGAADRAAGRAAARAAAHLRRHPDLGGQRHRDGDPGPRGGRRDARRPHHQPDGLRRAPAGSGRRLLVAVLAVAAEVGLGAVERAVTPQGHPSAAAGARRAAPRPAADTPRGGHNRHDHPTRTHPCGVPALPGSARAAAARRGRLAACGSDDNNDSSSSSSSSSSGSGARAHQDQQRQRQDDAHRRARRTSPSRRCSGRSTPRRFDAAGYKVQKELNLGDEQTALKALKSGTSLGLPRVHRHGAAVVPGRQGGRPAQDDAAAYDQVKAGMAKQGITASRRRRSPTPTRSAVTQGDGRQARR